MGEKKGKDLCSRQTKKEINPHIKEWEWAGDEGGGESAKKQAQTHQSLSSSILYAIFFHLIQLNAFLTHFYTTCFWVLFVRENLSRQLIILPVHFSSSSISHVCCIFSFIIHDQMPTQTEKWMRLSFASNTFGKWCTTICVSMSLSQHKIVMIMMMMIRCALHSHIKFISAIKVLSTIY